MRCHRKDPEITDHGRLGLSKIFHQPEEDLYHDTPETCRFLLVECIGTVTYGS